MVGQAVNLATDYVLKRAQSPQELVLGDILEAKILNATQMFINIISKAKNTRLNEITANAKAMADQAFKAGQEARQQQQAPANTLPRI